jgi:hypothetical protein
VLPGGSTATLWPMIIPGDVTHVTSQIAVLSNDLAR